MARELGKLYVGVDCSNCGVHGEGEPATDGRTRCGKCGQFGSRAEQYCAEHDIDYSGVYHGASQCPYCEEEQRVQDMMMHEATRDPQVEPW